MIPRISVALTKFLKPITSSSPRVPETTQQKEKEFQRFRGKRAREKNRKPGSEILTPKDLSSGAQPAEMPQKPEVTPPEGEQGAALSFISLMSALQEQKGTVFRWLGARAYKSSMKDQRKVGRFRKGTIIDKKFTGDPDEPDDTPSES